MFMSAMILIRLTSDWPIGPGSASHLVQGAVGADAHPHAASCGSMCTSDARSRTACSRMTFTTLTTGAFSSTTVWTIVSCGCAALRSSRRRLEQAERVAELGRRRVATVEGLVEVAVYGELDPHQRAQQLDELRVEVLGEGIRDRDLDREFRRDGSATRPGAGRPSR